MDVNHLLCCGHLILNSWSWWACRWCLGWIPSGLLSLTSRCWSSQSSFRGWQQTRWCPASPIRCRSPSGVSPPQSDSTLRFRAIRSGPCPILPRAELQPPWLRFQSRCNKEVLWFGMFVGGGSTSWREKRGLSRTSALGKKKENVFFFVFRFLRS